MIGRGAAYWASDEALFEGTFNTLITHSLEHEPTEGIGGGITRVRSPLAPDHRITGAIRAYVIKADTAVVNLGAWGAPANSISVPTSYTNPACTVHP